MRDASRLSIRTSISLGPSKRVTLNPSGTRWISTLAPIRRLCGGTTRVILEITGQRSDLEMGVEGTAAVQIELQAHPMRVTFGRHQANKMAFEGHRVLRRLQKHFDHSQLDRGQLVGELAVGPVQSPEVELLGTCPRPT